MGRRKTIDWPAFISEYESSGISVGEFCAGKGIHPNTFYRNRKRYQENGTALVRILPKTGNPQQQSLLVQISDFILKVPEGVDRKTLETTLQVLKELK
jgi:transposase-like protein